MAWYHTFFEGLPQVAWKQDQQEEYTDWEVDFLVDMLELKPGNQVLDIMSGYGRHALPLAERGFGVTAVDISAEYCAEMEAAARSANLEVVVMKGDFLTMELPETTCDAAYCFGNSFSFFDRAAMREFLQKIASQLRPGGRLAAHTQLLAESVMPHFQEYSWMPVGDDIKYMARNRYDAHEGVIHAELTYIRGKEQVTHEIEQHVYTLAELSAMLESSGFKVLETFGSLDGEPFALGDEQAYLLVAKR